MGCWQLWRKTSAELQADRELILTVVASVELRTDRQVFLAAMTQLYQSIGDVVPVQFVD